MRIVVVGATGTVGKALSQRLERQHEVVALSRGSDPAVDLADPDTMSKALAEVGPMDALICCAASAPLRPLDAPDFVASLLPKLIGQVELVRAGLRYVSTGGAVIVTSGEIPTGVRGSAGGALVNAGLDQFVRAAAADLRGGLRLNAVSPGWIRESLPVGSAEAADATPVASVVDAYVALLEGSQCGEVTRP